MKKMLLVLGLCLGAQGAEAATIAAHRAVYDLSLVQLRKGTNLSSVTGRLAFEIDGSACDGWSVSFRMMNRFQPTEGNARMVDTQSTSFESGDGLTMRYNQKEFVNSTMQSETRIGVTRDAAGKEGRGELGEPGTAPFAVPATAAFPMQHQLRLMAAAEQGQSRDDSTIFDGSDGDKTFRAITFIGKRRPPALWGEASWPVTISYYHDTGELRDTPDYQVSFDLYENGVATGLVLDYDDFVLGGDLAKLEMLDQASCQ